ncbi:photosystem reaction center subunit H [Kitasatospora sp. MMS16-BH015]|uniref:PRC-barrel domain-containing protein n=1 Tax=Kitasatospora sp. MMS16-BH015 TaxID=2018025 RepID=UPI000CA0D38C|nr:PRC-barrel domain-containing protein [Kitasatospora sp. MMS16-BH015]AUG75344.1 photosystem reaction center subunit H [Kitasatospora sp. MMS16-BH015]
MIQVGDIREWRTHDVVDAGGHKIGTLEAIYVDTSTDEAAMATVQVGLPTRHRLVFVPLDGATVGPGYVKVVYDKALVKDCPAIGTDDVLPAEDEEAVFRHYNLAYQSGAAGERQLARR